MTLEEEILGLFDNSIRLFSVEENKVELVLQSEQIVALIAEPLIRFLDDHCAKNCVETVVQMEGKEFLLEIRRKPGLSMAQLRNQALIKVEELKRENELLRLNYQVLLEESETLRCKK